MEAHGVNVEYEFKQKQKEQSEGYGDVFVAPGKQPASSNEGDADNSSDGKRGRPALDPEDRNSPEDTAITGAQPKPSNEDGSEPQEE